VHESFESYTPLGGAFCVAHPALLDVEFVPKCKLTARIDLRGLHWNASLMWLTISSEVPVFPGDFIHNRLPAVISLLAQNRMIFHVGRHRVFLSEDINRIHVWQFPRYKISFWIPFLSDTLNNHLIAQCPLPFPTLARILSFNVTYYSLNSLLHFWMNLTFRDTWHS
jgi:hypothetical protein